MGESAKPRLDWIDAGKGLSIVLVVLYHATSWTINAGYELLALSQVNEFLAALRMPVFFFLSGLFAAKWVNGSWAALRRTKVALFAWVYLLWSLLELPAKWLAMAVLTDKVQDDFFTRQMLVIAAIPFRASGSLWFIWALLIFFVLAKATRTLPLWLQLSIAGAASLGVRMLPPEVNARFVELTGIGYRGILMFYVFFLLGCYFRAETQKHVEKLTPTRAAGIFIAWAAASLLLRVAGLDQLPIVGFVLAFGGLVGGLALAVILQRVAFFRWAGSRTLPIYLAHTTALVLILSLVQLAPVGSQLVGTIVAVTAAAGAILLSLVLYLLRTTGLRFLFEAPAFLVKPEASSGKHQLEACGPQLR